ncbi:MAG TPA: PDZ domain-containing protein, partial [Gemmatimonadaceae bacterium]|nr:PDZ domain-containing protein [Gemmatimonadaceae bacterium]
MYTRDSVAVGARKASGRARPLIVAPAVALAAAVALPLAAAPVAAQRTPEAARTCDSCDMQDSLAAVQRAYEKVQADYRRIYSKAMQQQMEAMRARMAANRSALEATQEAMLRARSLASAPAGWMGLTFSGSYTVQQNDNEKAVMRFEDYPTIEAVDPGSPAEKAGIKAGDKLLSLDGHDLTEGSPPFSELLRPGAKLAAKVKRGDRTRNVTITVGKRPNNYASSWGDWGDWGGAMAPAPAPAPSPAPSPAMPAPPAPGWSDEARVFARALTPTVTVRAMPSIPALAPSAEGWSLNFSGGPMLLTGFSGGVIAGAQVQRVKELADYFDVDDGLLVLHVIPGTPAERAGLRPGDVIRRAGDRTITTPTSLQRALAASDSRETKLDIVRKG